MEPAYAFRAHIGGFPDAPQCDHHRVLIAWSQQHNATGAWCDACGTPFMPTEAPGASRAA